MTVVFQAPAVTPALHALVVGVGHYPNLSNPTLGSAARSALAMATWLKEEYSNPAVPLGSIELLVSSNPPSTWEGRPLDAATFANFEAAVGNNASGWFQRASSNEDNIALIYFCGHGLEKGQQSGLLFQDFNPAPGRNRLKDSLDLLEFSGGLESCLARKQLLILDACRDTPSWLYALPSPLLGRVVIPRDLDNRPTQQPRQLVILRSTAAEQPAWGDPGGLSRFTQGMLNALRGPAADDRFSEDGTWEVRPETIPITLLHLDKQGVLPWSWGPNAPRLGGDTAGFVFHVPRSLEIPLRIGCEPTAHNAQYVFLVKDDQRVLAARAPPAARDWVITLEVPPTSVVVEAQPAGKPAQAVKLAPPCRKVTFR